MEFLQAQGASKDEICEARRAVQEVQLQRRDAEGYKDAKLFADVECHSAELDRALARH